MTREELMQAALEKFLEVHRVDTTPEEKDYDDAADMAERALESRDAEPERPWVTRCLQCGMSPRNSVHKNKRQYGYHTVQLGEHLTTEELINAIKKQP